MSNNSIFFKNFKDLMSSSLVPEEVKCGIGLYLEEGSENGFFCPVKMTHCFKEELNKKNITVSGIKTFDVERFEEEIKENYPFAYSKCKKSPHTTLNNNVIAYDGHYILIEMKDRWTPVSYFYLGELSTYG